MKACTVTQWWLSMKSSSLKIAGLSERYPYAPKGGHWSWTYVGAKPTWGPDRQIAGRVETPAAMVALVEKYKKRAPSAPSRFSPRREPTRAGYADEAEDAEQAVETAAVLAAIEEAGPSDRRGRGRYDRTLPAEVRVRVSTNGQDFVDAPLDRDERFALQSLVKRHAAKETAQGPEVWEGITTRLRAFSDRVIRTVLVYRKCCVTMLCQ